MPQPPQLAGFEAVLVHCRGMPQPYVLGGHTQAPAWQTVPPEHATPQAPQLLLSVLASIQAPAQLVSPVAQLTPQAA
jgi:hypothetical protein